MLSWTIAICIPLIFKLMKKYLYIVLLVGICYGQIVPDTLVMKSGKIYLGTYYSKDTWTQAFLEKKSQLNILREPLKNKVYFAGEIYDKYRQMGVPGAVLSGYDSIDKLLTTN